MASALQVKANRINAQASTGPTTQRGKAIVSTNARRHGLLSWKPVVAEFEKEEDWEEHRRRTMDDLGPIGHLETVLAERIALLLWRLTRVARFEWEAISTGQEDAEEIWSRRFHQGRSPLEQSAMEVEEIGRRLEAIKQIRKWPKNDLLDPELAAHIIEAAARAYDVKLSTDVLREQDVQLPNCPLGIQLDEQDWSAGDVRESLKLIAEAVDESMKSLLEELIEAAQVELDQAQERQADAQAELDRFRRRRLMPDEETMERVRRYETTFERSMLRTLHELQRLQAARKGQVAPLPVALDVNLSSDAA